MNMNEQIKAAEAKWGTGSLAAARAWHDAMNGEYNPEHDYSMPEEHTKS